MSAIFPVENKIMTISKLFIAVLICILGIIVNTLSGCGTFPQTTDENVWDLLARGEADRARAYFLGEVDVNDRDEYGRTPLHHAAEMRDPLLAAFFINLGAEIDALDNQERTPLSISAEKLDAPTAQVLTASGANIHHPMSYDRSPAKIAVLGQNELLSAILNRESLLSVDSERKNILHLAAEAGNAQSVDIILRDSIVFGQNIIGEKDNNGKTALDISLERHDSRNHAETAESLILAGAVSDNILYTYIAPAVRSSNYNIRSADGMAPIHFIARESYIGYLEFLLEKRVDVNIKNASGATALHEAARSGNIKVIELLTINRADINAQDAKGNSVLHIATLPENHLEAVYFFLSRGANPNLRDEHGDSPLHTLITLNRPENVVEAMLKGGADVTVRNLDGKTALYTAVERNRGQYIPLLLSYRSDVFAADNNGISPFGRALRENPSLANLMVNSETVLENDSAGNSMLHIAVKEGGDNLIISRILDFNAPLDARNNAGDTSLLLAVRQNEKAAGELLLSRGANIFAVNARGESPLLLTFPPAGRSEAELRQWMLNHQTLSSHDGLGNTALHYAANWRMDAWIPLIIQLGARTEAANATGETPLFIAVRNDFSSTIRVLVSSNAHLANRDSLGNSALHAAVRWNAVDAARTLIDLGIDINAHALNGKTSLHESVRLGMHEIESLLLWRGADIEVRDRDGNTPFMEAVMAGNTAAMERLVVHGADSNSRNFRVDTPLHISVAMERPDAANFLLEWGASIHARNSRARTPFQDALITSQEMVRTLLTRDRLYSSDDNGSSPLHIAVNERSSIATISLIMELGARISPLDYEGRTPLRLSLDLNLPDTAKLFADSGADVFISARDGKNSAEVALEKGEVYVRALFTGRAIYSRDTAGNTVLHYAARQGNVSVISLLISLGAGRDIVNIAQESPADIAMRWNHREAVSVLVN